MKTILIIDDEEKLRGLLARIISLEGFEVLQAGDCKSALKMIVQKPVAVALCDVKLPDGNGVELTTKLKALSPLTEIILLTAYGNIPDGVQAIKNGAFDYLTKGDDNNRMIPLLHLALQQHEKALVAQQTAGPAGGETALAGKVVSSLLIGKAPAFLAAAALAQKVAPTPATVLLTGETGTGKEVFAQAIHRESSRARQSFVGINCAAFSRELLESEMFGSTAGAFTGAVKERKGLFEEAHKGTLFLDEIGEMAPELQAKLLRVLETGELFRLGSSKPVKVDVRIIAATHRNLETEVAEGRFRQDLRYRISVFPIALPPLRERPEDLELLARHFLKLFAGSGSQRPVPQLTEATLEVLRRYNWPGNIRELRNVLERCLILSDGQWITPDLLPPELQESAARRQGATAGDFDLAGVEKAHILKVLRATGGNKTRAAELLQIAISTLYRKLEEYGIG